MELQVGVKIFLRNNEGKFLAIKRSPMKYPNTVGTWDIVGGRIDPGTPLIENLRREVHEEVNLEILTEPKFIFAQDILRGNGRHVVRLTYVGDTTGEPRLDVSENIAYEWLTEEEFRTHDDLDMYVKEVLDKKTDRPKLNTPTK